MNGLRGSCIFLDNGYCFHVKYNKVYTSLAIMLSVVILVWYVNKTLSSFQMSDAWDSCVKLVYL